VLFVTTVMFWIPGGVGATADELLGIPPGRSELTVSVIVPATVPV
jgi:hypothetical protein